MSNENWTKSHILLHTIVNRFHLWIVPFYKYFTVGTLKIPCNIIQFNNTKFLRFVDSQWNFQFQDKKKCLCYVCTQHCTRMDSITRKTKNHFDLQFQDSSVAIWEHWRGLLQCYGLKFPLIMKFTCIQHAVKFWKNYCSFYMPCYFSLNIIKRLHDPHSSSSEVCTELFKRLEFNHHICCMLYSKQWIDRQWAMKFEKFHETSACFRTNFLFQNEITQRIKRCNFWTNNHRSTCQ